MPSLYKGYCYADSILASKAELSETVFVSANNLILPLTASTQTNPQRMTMQYNVRSLDGTTSFNFAGTREYPTCTDVGYLTNYSGMELVDVVEVSWLVFGVWAITWAVKTMRRSL